MEETTKVKFSIVGYMYLLNQKNQIVQELNKLFDEQNSQAIKKCTQLGLLDEKGSIKGYKQPSTEQEEKEMTDIFNNFIKVFQDEGGNTDVLIELDKYEDKLAITLSDISKCIIP